MARVKQNEIITEEEIADVLEEDIDKIAKDKSVICKYYINLGYNAGIELQKAEKEKNEVNIQKYARQLWEANYNLVEILTDSSIKILFFYSKDAESEHFEGSYLDQNFIKNVLKYSPSKGFQFSISGSKNLKLQKTYSETYSISTKVNELYRYAALVLSSANIKDTGTTVIGDNNNNNIGITLKYTNHWKMITTRKKAENKKKKKQRRVYEFAVNYNTGENDTLGMYFYKSDDGKKNIPGYYYYSDNIKNRIAINYGWIREHTLEYYKDKEDSNEITNNDVRSILLSKTDTEEGYKKGDVGEYQVKGLNTKLMNKASVDNLIAMFKFLKKNETKLSADSIKDIFYKDNSKALKYIISRIDKKEGKETIDELIDDLIKYVKL